MTTLSREDLRRKVSQYKWAHSIDLGEGVVTQGMWGRPNPSLMQAFDRIDFRGKKVLDIGCWDGLWSFEAEKRGASAVYATDDISQRSFSEQPTFALAREVLQSKVKYFPNISVYDIRTLGVDDFDVVLFLGVYYHLKNPLSALTILRQVIATGGALIVEGPVIDNSKDAFATFFYHDLFADDVSNWWVPTLRCLREWIECSYFEITSEQLRAPIRPPRRLQRMFEALRNRLPSLKVAPVQPSADSVRRCVITARAVRRKDKVYELPDIDLGRFDVQDGE
jgi:tRNA (mo5U34)-methyltransferase